MKKKTLLNIKGAGRPVLHDAGIRHTEREKIEKLSSLHLTIKIDKKKAGLKNKPTLRLLHKAILKARKMGLGIIHYTLEYDHIHLLVEARSNEELKKGMQSFGICLSKGINKFKDVKGSVYKSRYHLRKLKSFSEIKNVLNYIFGNSIKHKKTSSIINTFNSVVSLRNPAGLFPGFELMIQETIEKSLTLSNLRIVLLQVLSYPEGYHLKKLAG